MKISKVRLTMVVSLVAIGALLASSMHPGNVYATVPGNNTGVSLEYTNTTTANGNSHPNTISGDGKYAVFQSDANNLVSSDTNNNSDVFIRNLATNTNTIVSTSASGVQGNGSSWGGRMGENGRYVAFSSRASNLIDGQTVSTSFTQTYLKDMKTGAVQLVTKNSSGASADRDSSAVAASGDGRFVYFYSNATNLLSGVAYNVLHVYYKDMRTGTFNYLERSDSGYEQPDHNVNAYVSCDGSIAAFNSYNGSLVTGDTNGRMDAFIVDLRNGRSISNTTLNADKPASIIAVSCNGRYAVVSSQATNLDPSASVPSGNTTNHLYLYDRINGDYKLVSKSTSGSLSNADCGGADAQDVSDMGIVTYLCRATNLVSMSLGPNIYQMYVHNPETGETDLLSKNSSGQPSNGMAVYASISADGKKVMYALDSLTSNILSSDTNGKSDIAIGVTGF